MKIKLKEYWCNECNYIHYKIRLSKKHIEKIRLSKLGDKNPMYGKISWNKGKHHSEETKQKIKEKRKNQIIRHSEKTKEKISEGNKGKKLSEDTKLKIRLAKLGKPQSEETIRKRFMKRPISSLEQKMLNIIQKHNLPYKFVGNGDFFIERKCPDFVNTNGKKIAIEVFYRKHKEQFGQAKNGIEAWKQERSALFAEYGWKVFYFDETEVNEDFVIRCL